MKVTMRSWEFYVKDILCKYGLLEYGNIKRMDNEFRFIKLFEQRCARISMLNRVMIRYNRVVIIIIIIIFIRFKKMSI